MTDAEAANAAVNEAPATQAETNADTTTTPANEVPKDPDQAEVELKLCKDIVAMPEEVKDRFKALKVLTD